MKRLHGGLMLGLSVASLLISSPPGLAATLSAGDADGTPHLLTELQFNSTTPMATSLAATATTAKTLVSLSTAAIGAPGWVIGAQNSGSIGVRATTGPAGTTVNALQGSYPQPFGGGGQYMWADYNVANLNTEDVYIEFWAKMPSQYKGGCKFLKVFGERIPGRGGADATILTDYTGVDWGAISQITFGDGTTLANDSQNVINFNGNNLQWMGRSYGTAVVKTPQMGSFSSADWGAGWHHFWVHIKFNSGTTSQNEVPDGEFYLKIDNKVYVDATGVYNRNPANGPINYIEFFGWAQMDPHPFTLYYDDIRISTGGFMSQTLPKPPGNVAVK